MPKDVYTTGQVSKIVGVCARTVAIWIDKGLLVGYRIGAHRKVRRDTLIRFCKQHDMGHLLGKF